MEYANHLNEYAPAWSEAQVDQEVARIREAAKRNHNTDVYKMCYSAIDLTTLSCNDSVTSVTEFARKTAEFYQKFPHIPNVASICIYPAFVETVGLAVDGTPMKITSVGGGFPAAQTFLEVKALEVAMAIENGADEVDKNFNGIKGGGAALLWEKIVATNSNKIVWIVDESKVVDTIGKFPLPVEVIPFGAGQVVKKFEAKGYKPVLRLDANGEPVRTDENNYVVDLHLERIDHPQELAQDLITTVGVVEHGLFLNMVDQVIVGDPNGPRVMDNPNK